MSLKQSMDLLGVRLDPIALEDLLDWVVESNRGPTPVTLMYLNVNVANQARNNGNLRLALNAADLIYCDGEGIRIGARLLGRKIPARMTGADFIWDLAARCAAEGLSLFWLGGEPDVARRAVEQLSFRFPALQIAGTHHGQFKKTESRKVTEAINSAHPDILLVGMGTPTQELWVSKHRKEINSSVVWCIGATADFIAGKHPRAPRWMLDHGMEWVFRLAWEPRRLFGRYVFGNPLFFARVIAQRIRKRSKRRPQS